MRVAVPRRARLRRRRATWYPVGNAISRRDGRTLGLEAFGEAPFVGDLKFVPQALLDTWSDLGKIELDGTLLRIRAENVAFQLTSAVRFVALLEGEDTHQLLRKVKPEAFVREIGGEVVTDSCLVGETAYQVEPGFLAEGEALAAAQKSKATRKSAPAPRPAAPPVGPAQEDEDLLTRFLVESLK